MKTLYVGTGPNWPAQKEELSKDGNEYHGIDIIPEFQPDIVRDILRGIPYDSDSFDHIHVEHVLEHISGMLACKPLDNFDFVMNEIHRVLKPGGTVFIEVPYWKDDIAIEAAGHIRFFAENSFINYYENPYHKEMGQCHFSEVVSNQIINSRRSGQAEARVLKIVLKK